jgi:L-amino acid N-acyltransferase YncA/protein-tyrosine-phosphatase
MAAGLVGLRSQGRIEVRSAGSMPAGEVNPVVVEAMRELGVDLGAASPKPLTDDAVRTADVVVTMGCGDACPVHPGKRYEDWELDDPAGRDLAAVRAIRDEIDRRVTRLVAEVLAGVTIEPLRREHWEAVARIYAEGIATGDATFETDVPSWEGWDVAHLPELRLVAIRDGDVVGWSALSPVSDRCVYEGVAEGSVYVAEAGRGQGVGRALLEELVRRSEAAGVWTIQAGIFPENAASIRLHESVGFRVVGIRERLGKQHGVWRDVAFLERRSALP